MARSTGSHPQTAAPDRLAATLAFDAPVGTVPQVSANRQRILETLGIQTVRDLLTHFPRRYVDLSAQMKIGEAAIGAMGTVVGVIDAMQLKQPRPRLKLVEISIVDDTGVLIVTMFRQPWLMDQYAVGDSVAVAGSIEFNFGFKRMTNPFLEKLDHQESTGRILAIHPATSRLSAAWMRRLIASALTMTAGAYDPLPLELREKYRLMSRGAALRAIHFPETMEETVQARRRFVYEELLLLEIHLMEQSLRRAGDFPPHRHRIDGPYAQALAGSLPFQLTDEQAQARDDVLARMAADEVMNHMILGDVGTGKTIVAAIAAAAAADSGAQTMFLAPTEVLARQHHASLSSLLGGVGMKVDLLVGSTAAAERGPLLTRFAAGEVDVLIGTHALLEPPVQARNLGLAIVDEQQRFGVDQRAALLAKGEAPDALYLTATPIPRTLALAIYGDLTLSYIKHRPREEKRATKVLLRAQQGDGYDAALAALERGEQVFVVCPLIDEGPSKKSGKDKDEPDGIVIAIEDERDFSSEVAGAVRKAKTLRTGVFRDYRVDLLHGGLSAAEKVEVMERFRQGQSQVLVATTIIEVGVDVPNATVMIIEDADRFGLSQLHQLRGRVGRGAKPAEVFLISSTKNPVALGRLSAMERSDDGFELATIDLSQRREGDILGNRQHGASALKMVSVTRDGGAIDAAQRDAAAILKADPHLRDPKCKALYREARLLFGDGSNPISA